MNTKNKWKYSGKGAFILRLFYGIPIYKGENTEEAVEYYSAANKDLVFSQFVTFTMLYLCIFVVREELLFSWVLSSSILIFLSNLLNMFRLHRHKDKYYTNKVIQYVVHTLICYFTVLLIASIIITLYPNIIDFG